MERALKHFWIGFIAGFVTAAIIFSVVAGVVHSRNRDREKTKYVELQQEIEALREDFGNRDFTDFLETVPDVRRAADGAADDFIRRRDEILHRFRNRIVD
jgi:hypothetical protein